mmetsp:Transcript_14897/g.18700  ORF Transcript_14897/g.18700 Transcript_14897/m.18700 type:complete len:140 (+) Transcript_14897:1277-1696(+)
MQLQLVLQMAYVSIPFDRKISLSEFNTEIFPGFPMSTVFIVAVCMSLFWVVLLLYFWPLYIEIDAENPARWYYPFSKSFWCKPPAAHPQHARSNFDDERLETTEALLKGNQGHFSVSIDNLESSTLQPAEIELVKRGQL